MKSAVRVANALLLGLLICGCAAPKKPAHATAAPPPPPNYNSVVLAVNSEPQGARVYQSGILVGKTPCELTYPIDDSNYATGTLKSPEIVVVADGYLPQTAEPSFEIKPQWRPQTITDQNGSHLDAGTQYQFGHLFLLQRDPAAKVVPQSGTAANARSSSATPAKSPSQLDQLQKAAGMLLQLKSLTGK
jgi:hypothetical protein